MNRSIFPIFNFKFLLINFIFSLFLYLFGFFGSNLILCDPSILEPQLIETVVNGIAVRHSPSIGFLRLYDSFSFLQHHILNTSNDCFKFNIYKYLQLDGSRFNRTHPYDHYHLNLYLENMYDVHYNLQFTKNPFKK